MHFMHYISSSRPEFYRHWDQDSFAAATTAMEKDGISIYAAILYRIPKSTLYGHVSGCVARIAIPDPKHWEKRTW